MAQRIDFTKGKILAPLIKFALPVLFALFLQAMYGAVDLLVVGKFSGAEDVSAVSTGSQLMMTISGLLSSLCMGIMLVPFAFMQSMSAFVAQNKGARKIDRAIKGFKSAVGISFVFGTVMFYAAFYHGDMLSGIFSKDLPVIMASANYLQAYAIDCLLTCFLFCFVGFFNGMGKTQFVMLQGIIGAFAIRVPVALLMSMWDPVTLFHIGLSIPCSTIIQISLCFIYIISTKLYAQ